MIEFVGNINSFWSIEEFTLPHRVKVAPQREYFHNNYSIPEADILQAFGDEIKQSRRFFKELGIEEGTISLICIEPGQVVPVHSDSFYKLRQDFEISIDQCVRYLIFLDNWELGHVVEFQETPITKWKKGDVWRFDHKSLHYAANASQTNFITCQVNTFLNRQ
jgi:hypothetical protein